MYITIWRVQLLSSEINHTKSSSSYKILKRGGGLGKYENEMEGKHLDGSWGSRLSCCEMDETGSEMCTIMGFVLTVLDLRLLLSVISLL
jgi:hypothetical protein